MTYIKDKEHERLRKRNAEPGLNALGMSIQVVEEKNNMKIGGSG